MFLPLVYGKGFKINIKGVFVKMRRKGLVMVSVVAMMAILAACNTNGNEELRDEPEMEMVVDEGAAVEEVEAEEAEDSEGAEEDAEGAEEEVAEAEPEVEVVDISAAQAGDIIEFGSYEQDGDESNGAEPIQWEVLKVEDGRALVISKYVLDSHPFNKSFCEVTWENCDLRAWLNEDFYNEAFTDDEKAQIPEVTLENPTSFTAVVSSEKDNDTNDKVFLLSLYEIYDIYGKDWTDSYGDGQLDALIANPTQQAKSNGVYFIADGGARWWLRSESTHVSAIYVNEDGETGWGGYGMDTSESVSYEDNGVRPSIYIEY